MAAGAKRGGKPVPLAYRAKVATRLLAGVGGGYGVASLAAIALVRTLPLDRLEATETATLTSFLVFLVVMMAAFSIRPLWLMLISLALAAIVLAAIGWLAVAPS